MTRREREWLVVRLRLMARLRSKQWQAGDWYLVGKAEFGREFLRRARAELSLRIHAGSQNL